MQVRTLSILIGFGFLFGCGGPDFELAAQVDNLYGNEVIHRSCSPTQADKIRDALDHLRDRVRLRYFEICMKEGMTVYDGPETAEQISAEISTSLPVYIDCDDLTGANGEAQVGISIESVTLDRDFVNDEGIESIAGVIAHEIVHNKGYSHPFEDIRHDIPYLADECVSGNNETGWHRSALSGPVALDHVGGRGAFDEREVLCPDGFVGRGFRAKSNGAGLALALDCGREVRGFYREYRTVGALPSGGTYGNVSCGYSEVMTGVEASVDGSRVMGVRPLCRPISVMRTQNIGHDVARPWVGSSSGTRFERSCPGYKVVTGLKASVDDAPVNPTSMWRLEVTCDDFHAPARAPETQLQRAGVEDGRYVIRRCEGNTVMTGLFSAGRRIRGGAIMDGMGAFCRTATGRRVGQSTRKKSNVTPVLGQRSTADFQIYECPAEQVMAGITMQTSTQGIGDAQPNCVSYKGWVDGTATPTRPALSGLRGAGGGSVVVTNCPAGEVAIALEARVLATSVKRLNLRCAQPESGVRTDTGAAAGLSSGWLFDFRCPGGGALTGVRGKLGVGRRLEALGGYCGHTRGNESYANDGRSSPMLGAGAAGLDTDRSRCDSDSQAVGVEIALSSDGTTIDGIQIACRRPEDTKAGRYARTGGTVIGVQPSGYLGCDQGEVLMGLRGQYSGMGITRLIPVCGPADLVPGDQISVTLPAGATQLVRRISLPLGRNNGLTVITTSNQGSYDVFVRRGHSPLGTRFDARGTALGWANFTTLPGLVAEDDYYVMIRPRTLGGTFAADTPFTIGVSP